MLILYANYRIGGKWYDTQKRKFVHERSFTYRTDFDVPTLCGFLDCSLGELLGGFREDGEGVQVDRLST